MQIKLTPNIAGVKNFTAIEIGTLILWFSYSTCVAAKVPHQLPVIAINEWSATTGKHLHKIPGYSTADRVTKKELDEYITLLINNLEEWPNGN